MSRSLLEFIDQVVLSELAPEADEDEVFGQWLDPEKRNLGVKEPNTPEENNAIQALRSFMSWTNNPALLSANGGKYAKMFLDLMKNHKYEPVLNPDTSFVYRGLDFGETGKWVDFFANHKVDYFSAYDVHGNEVDVQGKSFLEVLQSGGYSEIEGTMSPFVLQPIGGALVQSWSDSVDVACGFANQMGRGGVVLRANTEENNFFGTPGEIARLAGASPGERETISVGTVQVSMGMFVISRKFINEVDFIGKIEELER